MKVKAMACCAVIILIVCVVSAGVARAGTEAPFVTLFGNNAGALNTGSFVTFIGDSAGFQNSADDNTFVGDSAGFSNTSGQFGTFIGSLAGVSNTSGDENTFIGEEAGSSNVDGVQNTFLGSLAGVLSTSGNQNTFIGYSTGFNNFDGSGSVFLGWNAGSSETGSNKLYIDNCFLTDGQGNCVFPLIYGEFDNRLVAIDGDLGIGTSTPLTPLHVVRQGSGITLQLDQYSVGPSIIGRRANGTADSPTQILAGQQLFGFGVRPWLSDISSFSSSSIANFAFSGSENLSSTHKGTYFTIGTTPNGNNSIVERFRIDNAGHVGIGTSTPTHLIQLSGGAFSDGTVWQDVSSREYKENIKELTTEEAVKTLEGLNPVKYNYKSDKEDKHVGFIAEDVPDLVASKDRKGLSPMDIVAVLTKVVREQAQKLARLEAEVNRLKSKDMTARAIVQ